MALKTKIKAARIYQNKAVLVYDQVSAPRFTELLRVIAKHCPSPGKVFDVGCGTGTLLFNLHKLGWAIQGCDPSAAMRRAARLKNQGANIDRASATQFKPSKAPDLLTCTSDVINHIDSLSDVKFFLRRAFQCLAVGGIFIFDSITPNDIENNWPGYVQLNQAKNFYMLRYGAKIDSCVGTLTYDLFLKSGRGVWKRSTEVHSLRALEINWIQTELGRVGFRNIEIRDALTLRSPTKRTCRWICVAKKP